MTEPTPTHVADFGRAVEQATNPGELPDSRKMEKLILHEIEPASYREEVALQTYERVYPYPEPSQ